VRFGLNGTRQVGCRIDFADASRYFAIQLLPRKLFDKIKADTLLLKELAKHQSINYEEGRDLI
jgi:hypothetical protein